MKETLERLYKTGKFENISDDEILTKWGEYITQADIDEWKK